VFEDAEGKPLATPSVLTPSTLKGEELDRVLWGQPGARVEVTVERPGAKSTDCRDYARSRQAGEFVRPPAQSGRHVGHCLDEKLGVYYVRVLDFHRADLANELARLVTKFEGQKMKGLILDLRFTGSGLIDTAIGVADLFIVTASSSNCAGVCPVRNGRWDNEREANFSFEWCAD